jgi:MFS transporter, DHA2 family, multidrug resistance protein
MATAVAAAPERKITWREWVGFMAMVFGMFMAILDIQIVSASISEIQAGLSASPDEAAWVQTSYLIAEIVMIPLSGWLSRLLSTRVLFTLSAAGFTLFSVACAFSTSLGEMVTFRVLQGFLGGAMIPTVFATTYLMFPPSKRASMSVLIGLTATLAPTIGPTLGGWLTQEMSWHWLFLINVPFGIAVAVVVWLLLDIDRPNPELRRSFDLFGLTMMAGFLGALEYVLEEGNKNDWFQDQTIALFALVSAVCGALFFWRMLTRRDPMVDLRAFANRNFASGCFFSLVVGTGLYGAVYVVPVFLGRVRGYNSMQIGETMFVTGIAMFIASPIAGKLAAKVDLRKMLAAGLLMFGISLWWLGHFTSQSAFWEMLLPQALRGFSMMFVMLPANQIALGTLAPMQLKNASGLYNLMRNLGGAIGLALINTTATSRLDVHRLHLDEQVTWARPAAQNILNEMTWALTPGMNGNAQLAALKKISLMVEREALTLAYNDVLLLMSLAFFVALPLTLLLAKPKMAAAAGH